jgi:hypothetical protein
LDLAVLPFHWTGETCFDYFYLFTCSNLVSAFSLSGTVPDTNLLYP